MRTPAIHLYGKSNRTACGLVIRARLFDYARPVTDTVEDVTCGQCKRRRVYQRRAGSAGILRERVMVDTEGRR